jgi:hypothetical protein
LALSQRCTFVSTINQIIAMKKLIFFFCLLTLAATVQGDGGYLFILALVTAICCATVAWIRRRQIPIVEHFFWD